VVEIYPFLPNFPNYQEYMFSKYSFMLLWISVVFVVMLPFSISNFTNLGSFFLLLGFVVKGLLIFLILSENQIFISLILCIVLLVCYLLISTLCFIIFSPFLGLMCSCSKIFKCIDRFFKNLSSLIF
jgi:hypothetical protein